MLERENTAFVSPQTGAPVANESAMTTPVSVEDKFFQNIEPFRDPATGKYNKTLRISTESMKTTSSSVTAPRYDSTPFWEADNSSDLPDLETWSPSEESEFQLDDNETASSTQMHSDGTFSDTPSTSGELTSVFGKESTFLEVSTDSTESSTATNFSMEIITELIVETTSGLVKPENVTLYFENSSGSWNSTTERVSWNSTIERDNSTNPMNLSTSTRAGVTKGQPESTTFPVITVSVDGGGTQTESSGSTCNLAKESK